MINSCVLQEVVMGWQFYNRGAFKCKEHVTSKWANVVFNHELVTKSNHQNQFVAL